MLKEKIREQAADSLYEADNARKIIPQLSKTYVAFVHAIPTQGTRR